MSDDVPPGFDDTDEGRRSARTLPYALVVPVLVVMVQSAWVIQGWNFRNTLVAGLLKPDGGMIIGFLLTAGISFRVIRPLVHKPVWRWLAIIGCVVTFAFVFELLMPHVAG